MRSWAVGLIAGVVGLGFALLGDAVEVYKGFWIYLGLVPAAAGAVVGGPLAGLLAGLIAGAAGGSPFVALALGVWLSLVGWVGRRRPGLTMLFSVPAVLVPLVAAGFGLGDQRDAIQVVPLIKSLSVALAPTALALGVLGGLGFWAQKRYGWRPVTAGGVLLLVAAMPFSASAPWRRAPAPVTPALAGAGEGYRAAFATVDVTPSPELLGQGIYMGGYGGRPGPATSVHDPITLRTMALEQGGTRVVFVQLDTVGMGNRLYQRLRTAAATAAGTEHIFIGSTHSHSAPDLQGIWGGVPAAYEEFLVRSLGGAVADAVTRLEPVELRAGQTRLQVARNRRDWGFVPEELNVLQAVAPGRQVVATLVNFSVHPTVLPRENMALSSDFVGPMLAAVGGPALFLNGAQGDVLPDTAGLSGDMYEKAAAFGALVAKGVAQAAEKSAPVAPGPITVKTEEVFAPLENWQLQTAMSLGLARYDMAHKSVVPGVRAKISAVRLGPGVTMVTVPGEMMTRIWGQVEKGLPAGRHFVLGLTQESLGYIITHDEWHTGRNRDYEESVSLGPVMGPLVERTILRLAQ